MIPSKSLLFLVAFLLIGLSSSTILSRNDGGGGDEAPSQRPPHKRSPAGADPPGSPWHGDEDEAADLWRRFLLLECWDEAKHRTTPLYQLERHKGVPHVDWVRARLRELAPSVGGMYGDVWECGGLRLWAKGWHRWELRDSWRGGDDRFRAQAADPRLGPRDNWYAWTVHGFWWALRRGWAPIPLLDDEMYPRFNESQG